MGVSISSMRARRLAAAALATTAILGVLPACTTAGGGKNRITVYSGRQKDLIGPLLERFYDETGIRIDVRYGDSADLALLIDTEGDQSPADVFLSQSPGAMGFLDQQGMLAKLDAETLDAVPARFRAGDGDWVGVTGRVRVLVYNTELVDPSDLSASVLDLTDPKYRGKVALAPTNASFQDFVAAMRAELGDERTEEWLVGMVDNGSPTYANNTAIVEAVARGEVAMGLVNHYYNEAAKAEDPGLPTENHFFAGHDLGTLVLVSTAGVLKTTGKPTEAERLVRFLLDEKSQEYFATETLEYPLVEGVAPAGDLPPLDQVGGPETDLSELPELKSTRDLIERSGLEQS